MKTYTCTIEHVDTCLSDYYQGFAFRGPADESIAVSVDHTTTVGAVIAEIADGPLASSYEDWTDAHAKAFAKAVADLRAENADRMDRVFDSSLEETDDEDAEIVYAYFHVRFTED